MKWICAFAAILFLLSGGIGRADAQINSAKIISGGFHHLDKFSIKDQIFDNGWWTIEKPHFVLFDLAAKYSKFDGWIGVPDDNGKRNQKYRIAVDGATVMTGKISPGDSAIHAVLDLTGAHSMRIELDDRAAIGNPVLTLETSLPSAAVMLASPADKTKVTADTVTLQWQPVEGAVSYGVEIVSTKLHGPSAAKIPRIWVVNALDGETQIPFDLKSVPNGEYHWSVIAFSASGVIGKFSKDRTFFVIK